MPAPPTPVTTRMLSVCVAASRSSTANLELTVNHCQMDKLLTEYEEKTGIHVPIHVDAASGGFVAPFAHPNFKMSFDLPRVVSINTSGHKFGLAFVGVGWVVWRSKEFLPKELVFEVSHGARICTIYTNLT